MNGVTATAPAAVADVERRPAPGEALQIVAGRRAEERRRRREDTYARREPELDDRPLTEGLSPGLEAGLRELSAAEREVIALRVVLELDGDTAARILGISRTACSTRLSRALHKLEEKVRSHAVA